MMFDLPPPSDEGQAIAAYYLWLFPNMMFNFTLGTLVNIVIPARRRRRCSTEAMSGMQLASQAGSVLDTVEHQDQWVIEEVQKSMPCGLQSRALFTDTGTRRPSFPSVDRPIPLLIFG